MQVAKPTDSEEARIALLQALKLLDSPPEENFDRITRIAAQVMRTPIALVSLVDRERQWFKSKVGLEVNETPRDYAFCAHAIHNPQPLIVPDALQDARFADNPLVTSEPNIRFYAGAPIFSANGIALGTLCIIDRAPRVLSAAEVRTLEDLAALAQREIAHREATELSISISARSERAMLESDARFQATFEQAAVGIGILCIDGRWSRVNRKLCDFLGYTEQELLPLGFQDITHPDDLNIDLLLVQQVLDGIIPQYNLEKRYIRRDGSVVWANLSVSLQRDSAGNPMHFISVVADIQARKEAEESLQQLRRELEDRVNQRTLQLQQTNQMLSLAMEQQRQSELSLAASEGQLRAVLENAQDAYICINEAGIITQWNRQAELTFGWSRDEAIDRRLDETIMPVQHRAAHRQGMKNFLATGKGPVLNKRLELMAIRRDGTLFPIEIRVSPLPSEQGHQFCAFLHDISERKQIEEELLSSRNQLHTITDNLPVQIAYIDAELKFRFANEAYRSGFDLAPESIMNRTLQEVLGEVVFGQIEEQVRAVLSGQRITFEITTNSARGKFFWNVIYIPDINAQGVAGFYVMAQDVTMRKELEISLQRQATLDALTGLPNRRALLTGLARAIGRCNRAGDEIGILFLDLDGFKGINDRYGHDAGDYSLRQFAERLQTSVRDTDIVARLAGDEFVVVLESLRDGAQEAQAVATQIIGNMCEPVVLNGDEIALNTSIGIYVHRAGDMLTAEKVIAAADLAMYEAKRSGSNRIFLANVD